MSFSRSRLLIWILGALVMFSCVIMAEGYCADQRNQASAAAQEAHECKMLANGIASPAYGTTAASRPTELNRTIAAAAANAGFPDGSLEQIHPGEPRRALDGLTMEKPIELSISHARMGQLVNFLHTLASPPNGLRAVRLEFTMPDSAGADEWAAQVTLTYPIVDDKPGAHRAAGE